MSIIGTIYEDVTTEVLGRIGRWQWMVTLLSSTLMLSSLFNQYEDMLLLEPPNVDTVHTDNIINSSLCFVHLPNNVTQKRSKWKIKFLGLFWMNRNWMLFCENEMQLLSVAMICRLGVMFGCVIFGLISDSCGRKMAMVVNTLADIVLRLVLTFCNLDSWFRLLVFLRALLGSANDFMGLILVCEIASNRWRSILSMVAIAPRLLSTVYKVPLANSMPNLATYNFIGWVYAVICFIILRRIPESPQWLLFNRKISGAEKILYKAATKNGKKLCSNFKIRPVNHSAYNCLEETWTCIRIISTYNVRVLILYTLVFWMLYNFLWSLLFITVYRSKQLSHVLMEIFCFALLFGCLNILASAIWRMKYLLLCHIFMTGVLAAALFLFGHFHEDLRDILSSVGIASGLMIHALSLNITPRLFGVQIRGILFGSCFAAGQLGTIVAYLLVSLQAMDDLTIVALVLSTSLASALLCALLPNVDRRELPDVVVDMDYFSELSKPLRWATQQTSSTSREEIQMRIYSFSSNIDGSLVNLRNPAQRIGLRLWRIFEYCRSCRK